MTGSECFTLYVRMKALFNPRNKREFDQIHVATTTTETFEHRNDYKFYEKFAEKYSTKQAQLIFALEFFSNTSIWIGEIMENDPQKKLNMALGFIKNPQRFVTNEVGQLLQGDMLDPHFFQRDMGIPILMTMGSGVSPFTSFTLYDLFKGHINNDSAPKIFQPKIDHFKHSTSTLQKLIFNTYYTRTDYSQFLSSTKAKIDEMFLDFGYNVLEIVKDLRLDIQSQNHQFSYLSKES